MKPMEGITVIEFGEYVSAPGTSRFLGEWGARVIKVERPEGDRQRIQCKSFGMTDQTEMEWNHNMDMMVGGLKEYISIDTKTEAGMAILHKLLENADVFLTNMRPKALEKMELDYDSLKDKYPRLVYGMAYGYGPEGKYRNFPGYDAVCYSARGGILACFPQKGDAPGNVPLGFGDFQAHTTLAAGVAAALLGREKSGKGDFVSVSLYHTAMYMNSMGIVASNEPYNNVYPKSSRDLPNPLNNSYQCKDGKWLLICEPVYNLAIKKVLKMLGRDDLVDDPFWTSFEAVLAAGKAREAGDIIIEGFKNKTRDEWIEIFEANDVPGGPCYDFIDIAHDPFAWENNFLRKNVYPDGSEGLIVDLPVRLRSVGLGQLGQAKRTGRDTYNTLKTYGYTEDELDSLKAAGAIYTEMKK